METAYLLAFVAGVTLPLLLDLAGHTITNRRITREVLPRCDRAEERGAKIAARVDEIAKQTKEQAARAEGALAALLDVAGVVYDDAAQRYVQRADAGDAAAAFNGGDPRDAREARKLRDDARAAASERIRLWFHEQLGEAVGEQAFDYAQKNRTAWKRATDALASGRMESLKEILGPTVTRYSIATVEAGASAPTPASGASTGKLPF